VPARPAIEIATLADLPAISALRLAQGWGASAEVVRAVLGWECGRLFVIRASQLAKSDTALEKSISHTENDPPVVTTCAIAAGPVGVIGCVIVRADYQRRGLGRLMMEHALNWQREQGVKAVYLDATPAGRPLYNSLGFVSLGVYSWFTQTPLGDFNRVTLTEFAGDMRASVVDIEALARIGVLDARAYGGDRLGLLASLLTNLDACLITVDDATGQPAGYLTMCLTSRSGTANYKGARIGPWVAVSEQAAAALLLCAVEQAERWRMRIAGEPYIIVALPETNPCALALLRAAGCQPKRDDLLMLLDLADGASVPRPGIAGDPALVYAWLASMTF